MKYVLILHANLNYAYLTPDRYEFVIRKSYEMTLDTLAEHFPEVKFTFEASGYTIEEITKRCPDVLEKLKTAITEGRCEFMGSPQAHPMLPNFPEEDGLWSIRFSNETYEKYLGLVPKSFWNPECGWRSYIPRQVQAAGYTNLIGDFEAYSRSLGADGKPLRPEIYEKEHTKEKAFYHFGFKYDLPGDEKAIHFPFVMPVDRAGHCRARTCAAPGVADTDSGAAQVRALQSDSLRVFLRSDRIAQFGVRYFMGMEGYTLEKYLELIEKYSAQQPGEPEGALIVFADDAEYIGTNGWFRLKYQNLPDNTFEHTPQSRQKLIDLLEGCRARGGFATFDEACQLPPRPDEITFDDDSAWHGGQASTWAQTPMARLLRPWQDLVREKLQSAGLPEETQRLAWLHLTNSFNSDGQWPPTLPEAPHIVHPFNYGYNFDNLLQAELLVGGVDRSRLQTDPMSAIQQILTMQGDLILKKAQMLLTTGSEEEKQRAQRAKTLIETSRNLESLKATGPLLYPSDYAIRADALAEARRLVGGVEIEVVQDMQAE